MSDAIFPLEEYLAIFPGTSEEIVIRTVLQLAMRIGVAAEGSLLIVDRENEELVFAMTVGGREAEGSLRGQRLPLGAGLVGLAVATGDVQIGSPTYFDVKQMHRVDQKQPEAVLAAPVSYQKEIVAVMTLVDFTPGRRFGRVDAETFSMFGKVVGLLIEQSRFLALARRQNSPEQLPKSLSEQTEMENEVVSLLHKIVDRKRPEALAALLQVLRAIDSLIATPL